MRITIIAYNMAEKVWHSIYGIYLFGIDGRQDSSFFFRADNDRDLVGPADSHHSRLQNKYWDIGAHESRFGLDAIFEVFDDFGNARGLREF